MSLNFEWDSKKASQNIKKHRVSFEEATTVFSDPFSNTIPDPLHSNYESRFVILGQSNFQRILVVVHVDRNDHIRIISAREATRSEKRKYEEKN